MNAPTEPFDLVTFANQLLAGMAHQHNPPTDERPEDQQEQEERARGDAFPEQQPLHQDED